MRLQKAFTALIPGLALLGVTMMSPALATEGKPGGTLRLLANAAAGTADPHIITRCSISRSIMSSTMAW
ncbi:hypothetical protein NKJ40_17565 [Mesorhizobium sp. M0119]|uniref:hypothetical protein n=1 Tax=Mesorhizobium sp. M0119 TaxID=2956885 RepID=UPI003334E594